jgi:hypothetical protein
MIELEDGQQQMQRQSGVRLQLLMQTEENLGRLAGRAGADAKNLGTMKETSRDDVVYLAWCGTENACEVFCLFTGE